MDDEFKRHSEALDHASEMAGEILAEIGKTDLATFSEAEWNTFLKVIVKAWDEKMVPF